MATNDNSILRVEDNGIEYFTVVATGESAVSQIGLSRLSGIPESTLRRWLSNPRHKATPEVVKVLINEALDPRHEITSEELKALIDKTFYLSQPGTKKQGGTIRPILADVAADIIAYAALDLGKKQAIATMKATHKIGLTSFVQSKTGYLEEHKKASPQSHAIVDRILDTPDPWRKMYEKEFCNRVFSWFGAQFYWDFCYHFLTQEERCKLNRLNPDKKQRIHQYLESETKSRLKPRIYELNALVGSSTCRDAFLTAYFNLYGQGWQQNLLM